MASNNKNSRCTAAAAASLWWWLQLVFGGGGRSDDGNVNDSDGRDDKSMMTEGCSKQEGSIGKDGMMVTRMAAKGVAVGSQ